MRTWRRLRWFGAVRFAACCLPCFLPLLSSAQGLNLTGSSNCTAPDFDASLRFANGPADYYSIIIDKRNISGHPCVFDGPMYGPSFVPDRVEGHNPYGICHYCEGRSPNGQTPISPPITINPGQVARQTFRWRTTPTNQASPCLQPKWMAGSVILVAPSLLKKVCSDIEVSRFSVASSDSVPLQDQAAATERASALRLTSDKSTYDLGEPFSLRLSAIGPDSERQPKGENCPTLYLKQRSPDGATRVDEVQPLAFKGCGQPVLGHQPGDWRAGFDLDSGANSRWEGTGEHLMEVFQMAGSPDETQVRFVSSNVLRVEIADPAAIPRKWGQRVKGVAADITLDKDTFRLGEDVPLHLAIEDFGAEVPVYSWDPLWDPCMTVGIEVRDSGGHQLPVSERFPPWSICMGHGFGPRLIAKGKLIPIERTLGRQGWLPNRSGTYTIVITWAPCAGPKNVVSSAPEQSTDLKPYAVVQATTTIHIVNGDDSHMN